MPANQKKSRSVPFRKLVVLDKFELTGKKEKEFGAKTHTDKPTKKEKKVMFQLRSEIEESEKLPKVVAAESLVQENSSNGNYSLGDEQPAAAAAKYEEDETYNDDIDLDPNDLTQYGIYFKDDYDYAQHLRDPNDFTWSQQTYDSYRIEAPISQGAKKKSLRQQMLEEQAREMERLQTLKEEEEDYEGDGNESDLFSEESFGELPDNLMDILDAGGEEEEEECEEDKYYKERYEDNSHEVDYSKMPPLEAFEKDSNNGDDSDASADCMDVSDSEHGSDNNDLYEEGSSMLTCDKEFPALSMTTKSHKPPKTVDYNQQAVRDSFFDNLGEVPDVEDEPSNQVQAMQSSRFTHQEYSDQIQMLNEKFDALLDKDFAEYDIGAQKIGEVEGDLEMDAEQFKSTFGEIRVKRMEENVALVGEYKEKLTEIEQKNRDKAIAFTKAWQETKDKPVEVILPDPKSMKFNVSNLPSILTDNAATVVRTNLYGKKKRKGLSVKDLKKHDNAQDISIGAIEEDVATYKTLVSEMSYRPPDETPEERRERKTVLKTLRLNRRQEKKLNKVAFKVALQQTSKVNMNAKHCQNMSVL